MIEKIILIFQDLIIMIYILERVRTINKKILKVQKDKKIKKSNEL